MSSEWIEHSLCSWSLTRPLNTPNCGEYTVSLLLTSDKVGAILVFTHYGNKGPGQELARTVIARQPFAFFQSPDFAQLSSQYGEEARAWAEGFIYSPMELLSRSLLGDSI